MDQGFHHWATKGLTKIGDMFQDEALMSFEQLRTKFGLSNSSFYKY